MAGCASGVAVRPECARQGLCAGIFGPFSGPGVGNYSTAVWNNSTQFCISLSRIWTVFAANKCFKHTGASWRKGLDVCSVPSFYIHSMKFDKLKPDLQNLNLAGVKKAASRAARVRVKLSRRQWIAIACAVIVVGLLLALLLRPRPASVTLPVVAVEPVTTEDVNIYGDYVRPHPRPAVRRNPVPVSRATSKRCFSPKAPISRKGRRFS